MPDNIDLNNAELQNALQLIQFTHHSVFLTGKAGTGKSTLLRYICQTTKKKHVVLAPTGIAAINAGGSTLHSFFKLPFHPLLPDDTNYSVRNMQKTQKYTSEQRKLLREVELIIIDEISMVRADIIDFIDRVLRIYSRNMRQPFGGKQLLFVGDVYQLEPVIREEERQLLRPYYPSIFFFHARVFREMAPVCIELRKVYRQTDPAFIGILDSIRAGSIQPSQLQLLNSRVGTETRGDGNDSLSITLATRRDQADYINDTRLQELPGDVITFTGTIQGEFPETMLPTPRELDVKVGAQVIFIKNDMDKRWVNGTLGIITAIDMESGIVYVDTEEKKELEVEPDIWRNVRYRFNETEKKIEEEELGIYTQYPLRLAWAITVHKSQGLTFRHAVVDLTGGVFAGGQTYVALSRCTSLEGLVLTRPVSQADVFVRKEILQYARTYNDPKALNVALSSTRADQLYFNAVRAFEKGDMGQALDQFFLAIHSRYDIEKPSAKRLIRRKLNILNTLRSQIQALEEERKEREKTLKRLAAEYVIMGKECEKEHMPDAAIRNYQKALELYPETIGARKRLDKLLKARK